jgi:hypothetical protein
MTKKTELEKLRILLPHWIEHSHSHQKEFEKWADTAEQEGETKAASEIKKALTAMADADTALKKALESLGGQVEGHHHHHHH